ncbi:hypothetical protein [Sulfuritalea sp.]|uniref:hypothetical protein n=1 Tax=Sulfuritalea sp. TaxID=2480090 RepID=UPI001AC24797|nr:hypothetical protein [Sulfuritalea sp.]MBN8474521.1 hypothetical protein [Sulfuritalea sp.]
MTTFLIAAVATVALWVLVQFVRNSRPSYFSARVSGALFDLGLQITKFEPVLNKMYIADCVTYYEANGKRSNPWEMAARFFLKAVIEYPAFVERAVMFDGFLVRSIKVVKSWRGKKINAAFADDFVIKIKTFLIDGLKDQPMPEDEKIATEIIILEL